MGGYIAIDAEDGYGRVIKTWHKGVKIEDKAIAQLKAIMKLPFVYKWAASMPDCHWGNGSAVGTVGIDIGCGMCVIYTGLRREDFGDNLGYLREQIERAVISPVR